MAKKKVRKARSEVSRADIEAKLKQIDKDISDATSSAADKAKVALGIAVAVGLLGAFIVGKRKGLRPKTYVTFTRLRK
jgi:hypothetical protein